ncbi:hypothetical protein [Umezawaea sp. Da 62-37]|uniref:hypothetical protein n=1 Tax=Umezawaea sp. Da 62-37 TaxID=3075927 RepID=UPI0028F6E1EF|nr:hypothetical protein [Umezawaea sp. Da 62-37]WNV87991.1 hypothetical protein RM788_06805 [Umezawaea sp. Da 62-37]
MRSQIQRTAAVVACAAAIVGLTAVAASATTSSSTAVEQARTRFTTDNLRLVTTSDLKGHPYTTLRMVGRPAVDEGTGEYFLYDPATGSLAGGFRVGGDMLVLSVETWTAVSFKRPVAGTVEVRFGDPADPSTGVVVASVSVS